MVGRVIDVSSAQHPNGAPIDWAKVAASGVSLVIVKATQGTTYTNPYFASDMAGAEAAHLDTMAYHFADFTNVEMEVAHFRAVAGGYAQVLDIETSLDWQWARTFLLGLERPPSELVTYGSASSLSQIYARLPSLTWVAAYGQGYPGYGVLWQFTSSATVAGITGPVDESSWWGTDLQYEDLVGTFAPPPPIPSYPPPKEEDSMWGYVDKNGNEVTTLVAPNGHVMRWVVPPPAADDGAAVPDDVSDMTTNAQKAYPAAAAGLFLAAT